MSKDNNDVDGSSGNDNIGSISELLAIDAILLKRIFAALFVIGAFVGGLIQACSEVFEAQPSKSPVNQHEVEVLLSGQAINRRRLDRIEGEISSNKTTGDQREKGSTLFRQETTRRQDKLDGDFDALRARVNNNQKILEQLARGEGN